MPAQHDDESYEDFRERLVLRKFKALLHKDSVNANRDSVTSCGHRNWWIALMPLIVCQRPDATSDPIPSRNLSGSDSSVRKGDALWCLEVHDLWLLVTRIGPWSGRPAGDPLGWVPWDGAAVGKDILLLKPLRMMQAEMSNDASIAVVPREGCFWSVCEIELFLSTNGQSRPHRGSAINRSDRPLCRAVRQAPVGIEYRMNDAGDSGGVFSLCFVSRGALVEVCPLHQISQLACRRSAVLRRLVMSVEHQSGEQPGSPVLPLGFARLYGSSVRPNIHWGIQCDDLVLWAARDVDIGQELCVCFDTAPLDVPHFNNILENTTGHDYPLGSKRLDLSGQLSHGPSTAHGRGVFASRSYEPGELVESCPLTLLDDAGAEELISYRWGLEGVNDFEYYLPHGLGAMYNHFEPPHVRAKLDKKRRVLEVYAEMPINCGQEIFITYGAAYFDDDIAVIGHSFADYNAPPSIESLREQS